MGGGRGAAEGGTGEAGGAHQGGDRGGGRSADTTYRSKWQIAAADDNKGDQGWAALYS